MPTYELKLIGPLPGLGLGIHFQSACTQTVKVVRKVYPAAGRARCVSRDTDSLREGQSIRTVGQPMCLR
jgi:hypothetical protein